MPTTQKPMANATGTSGGDSATQQGVLRCGVVGVGRMGRHHATKYAKLPGVKLVGVVDDSKDRREEHAERLGVPAFANEQELIEAGVDAVTIAVPTTYHLKCARPLLQAGVACLIEKPLANDEAEAQELADLAERHGATLMVGHIERFNPAVIALERAQRIGMDREDGTRGVVPRFVEMVRVSPMTFRSVDVSVVMDMMIHDLDVVLWLMGGIEPTEVQASGVPVLTEYEDVCHARLTFDTPNGKCVANISASRLALKTERKTRVIGENGYVSIDYALKKGVLIRKTANQLAMEQIREDLRQGKDLSDLNYHELVTIENLALEEDADQLEHEITTFLDAVRTGKTPAIDAKAGLGAVRTAHRIMEAARAERKADASKGF
ncbi:MAG: Gfo/Idh/MocA family oxidoreductase [Phycisphaerales bacterium]|nr:Gfo/Idh/MocA family oxidoreductase [Phycisphaerales bacterium]